MVGRLHTQSDGALTSDRRPVRSRRGVPNLSAATKAAIAEEILAGERPMAEIAARYRVSRAKVYQIRKDVLPVDGHREGSAGQVHAYRQKIMELQEEIRGLRAELNVAKGLISRLS